jgi:hypothetical protein
VIGAYLAAYFVPLAYCATVAAYAIAVHVRRDFPRARAVDAAERTWRRLS